MRGYITELLEIADQLKVYHLQTESYAEHKALGKAYDGFSELADDYLETCMGKHGRQEVDESVGIQLENYSEGGVRDYLERIVQFLNDLLDSHDPQNDSDLDNIVADMLALVNRTKYLLTLR